MDEFKFEDEQDSSLPEVSDEVKDLTYRSCWLSEFIDGSGEYEKCVRAIVTRDTENKELKGTVFSQMVGLSAGIPTAVGAGAISGALGITFLPKLLLQLFKR